MIILSALSTALNAQEIVTDRPDQTESSITIPDKSFQMELGFGSGNYYNERLSLLPTALFRFGLTEYFELRFVEQLAGFTNMASEQDFGLSDIELGAKIQVLKKEGINTEIAFISHVVIPSGSSELTNKYFGTVNKLAISHGLNSFLDLGYNFGYNYFGTGNGDLTYTAAIGAGILEKLGLYFETFGEYSDFRELTSNLDSGITYLIEDNVQLDFSLGTGLNRKMNYFSFGFSWNIKCNHYKNTKL
jgi:hypothetical protein